MLQVESVSLPAPEAALWLRLRTQRIAFSDHQEWFRVDMFRVVQDTTENQWHFCWYYSERGTPSFLAESSLRDCGPRFVGRCFCHHVKPENETLVQENSWQSRDLRSWWCYQAALKTPNPWSLHVPWSVNSLSLNWYFCPLQQKESSLVLQWQRYSQGQRLETVMGQSKIHMGWWHVTGGGLHESSFFSYRVSIIIEEDKGHCFSPSSDFC